MAVSQHNYLIHYQDLLKLELAVLVSEMNLHFLTLSITCKTSKFNKNARNPEPLLDSTLELPHRPFSTIFAS